MPTRPRITTLLTLPRLRARQRQTAADLRDARKAKSWQAIAAFLRIQLELDREEQTILQAQEAEADGADDSPETLQSELLPALSRLPQPLQEAALLHLASILNVIVTLPERRNG